MKLNLRNLLVLACVLLLGALAAGTPVPVEDEPLFLVTYNDQLDEFLVPPPAPAGIRVARSSQGVEDLCEECDLDNIQGNQGLEQLHRVARSPQRGYGGNYYRGRGGGGGGRGGYNYGRGGYGYGRGGRGGHGYGK